MRPLEGTKVVELSMWVYVPAAASVLREWGADVLKIEHPAGGDPVRGLSIGAVQPGERGVTFMWEIYNRAKKSVGINVRVPEGRELFLELIAEADVFLTSLLPEARRSMGIDIDDLMAVNPSLIYAIGSGYGPRGPHENKAGNDQISFWSRGGMAAGLTKEGQYPPMMPAGAFGDSLSGAVLAGGVCAALVRREKTGSGAVVDGSLLATALWAVQASVAGTAVTGRRAMPGFGREDVSTNPLVNVYRTRDDRYVSLGIIQADRYWQEFCEALERPDLIDDARFKDADARRDNIAECVKVLDDIFSRLTLDEAVERLNRQGGPWDVVRLASELRDDPQVIANGYVQPVEYGGVTVPMVAAPVQFDRHVETFTPAPGLAEHTETVLLEHGLDWDAIIALKVSDAIA